MKILQKYLLLLALLSFHTADCVAGTAPASAHEIFVQDQAERDSKNPDWNGRKVDWAVVHAHDAARRSQMRELLQAGKIRSADDFYGAAVVFQHGNEAEEIELAHALAVIAMNLDPAPDNHRYMVAATWDRYLQQRGSQQWYGTQYVRGEGGKWTLYPVDGAAIDDATRRKMAVPTLAEARDDIRHLNGDPK